MRRAAVCVAAALVLAPGLAVALELSPEEVSGKRIFAEGISGSGNAIYARVGAAGTSLPAALLPCGSCHGADGRGRPEGGVRPPDITWQRLSVPYGQRINGRSYPAYDDAALARAVIEGIDPAGNRLDPAMPRFVLSVTEQRDLTAYLKRLAEDRDPGVETERLRLGTLLPVKGPQARLGHTVEAVLRGGLQQINAAGGIHGRQLELLVVDPGADAASASAALQRLLEQEQIFALVAPLLPTVDGRFSELLKRSRVPLIGPLSFLGDQERNPHVFEVLPGLREQLLALGRFASQELETGEALILYQDNKAFAKLAALLAEQLERQGWSKVRQQVYTGQAESVAGSAADALFFLGNETAFALLGGALQGASRPPSLLAVSSQVAGSVLQLPTSFAGKVFLAYPFIPADWTQEGTTALARVREQAGLTSEHMLLQVSAFATIQVLAEGLRRAGRDASRRGLVTGLESLHGFRTGLTPVLEYGPGQRVGAAGAHIVQVDIAARRFSPVGGYLRLQRDW
ncbi:MAG: ABC transporter substrate-binding protein [Pseudomonas sp.]